jgi:hypothetical protein
MGVGARPTGFWNAGLRQQLGVHAEVALVRRKKHTRNRRAVEIMEGDDRVKESPLKRLIR